MKQKIGIAGAGFAGAVLARELAESGGYTVTVYDERSHVAGNCHTFRDPQSGIMIHQYGPHIFNTSREEVWNYLNRWGKFGDFRNQVKAVTKRGVFSLPMNLLTLNQFFGKKMNPREAHDFMLSQGDVSVDEPKNFEEQALKFLGKDLYKNFFYGYTKKQWGVEPTELPASILKRLPVRFNYDDNYYNQKYQGIPVEGYTKIIENILDHEDIKVHLGKRLPREQKNEFAHLFWSGPMDAYFNFDLGRLGYRTLKFERFDEHGDYQGNAVINYCAEEIPYTRIAEHKHFAPWEEHAQTVCFREYSAFCTENDIPYYPLRLNSDKSLLEKYISLIEKEDKITFIGRMGTYRYLDMHVVIGESLDLAKICLEKNILQWPKFSHHPL
ncbi:MAG TPA: UDP-galactopyranose mutase [Pseudobdellovibrionaceae bacterium]|jgi:UDP-galactopyranose mutase